MYIHITPEEFEDDFKELWKQGLLIHPHIDYVTNAIHCYFENKDVIIFKFKNYGFINDNRFNKYEISSDTTGITIKITKSNYL
jgi:hypothetical protein